MTCNAYLEKSHWRSSLEEDWLVVPNHSSFEKKTVQLACYKILHCTAHCWSPVRIPQLCRRMGIALRVAMTRLPRSRELLNSISVYANGVRPSSLGVRVYTTCTSDHRQTR